MLQNTALRIAGLNDMNAPMVVCNEDHRFMVAEQLRAVGIQPDSGHAGAGGAQYRAGGRDGRLHAQSENIGADPLLLILPADHVITDVAGFRAAILQVAPQAEARPADHLRHRPDRPGNRLRLYQGRRFAGRHRRLHCGASLRGKTRSSDRRALSAIRRLLLEQRHVPVPRLDLFVAELERFAPAMLAACQQALVHGRTDRDFLWLDRAAFAACPKDSIDYAVMEKTGHAVVMPLAMGWNDVGSWSALWDVGAQGMRTATSSAAT